MVEDPEREKIPAGRRAPEGREWEVFIRQAAAEPLQHVGSVREPSPDAAHAAASRLFDWYATDVWVVPAEAVHRYATDTLSDDGAPPSPSDEAEQPVEF
jgi:rSAM-partnered protein